METSSPKKCKTEASILYVTVLIPAVDLRNLMSELRSQSLESVVAVDVVSTW